MLGHNQHTDKHNKKNFEKLNSKYILQYKHIKTKILVITNLILTLTILIQIMKLDTEMESIKHTLLNLQYKFNNNKK